MLLDKRFQLRCLTLLMSSWWIWSLAIPQPTIAQPVPATCSSGYALWANNSERPETLMLSGSDSVINGAMHSNADLRLSGSRNQISGAVEYATLFSDQGDANRYPTPGQRAASAAPFTYNIADYRPGGAAALAAQVTGNYTVIDGTLDVSDNSLLDGLYYVTGDAKLSTSNLSGTYTIVAEGMIDVSGSQQNLRPFSNGLLLFANKQEPGGAVIKLAGSNSALHGVIYSPGGMIELSGSAYQLRGVLLADSLKLSGSHMQISFDSSYCPGGAGDPPPYQGGEIVVKLRDAADLPALAAAYNLDPTPLDQFGSRPIFLLRIADGSDPASKANQLRPASGSGGDERVEYAEPNFTAETPETRRGRGSWVIGGDDRTYAAQWAPATMRLAEAHTITRGAGVIVAVLDTGVTLDHPALQGRLMAGYDFVDMDADPSEVGDPSNPGYGHGTHVAGLIALTAPEAKIMPVRVLDKNGRGNIWVLAEGLLFAAEYGPDGQPGSGDEAQVLNLSFGTLRETRLLADLAARLACGEDDDDDDESGDDDDDERCQSTGGVVVIAAAGNGGDTTPQYPAAEDAPGMLALGASTPSDTQAAFSTYGSWVRLVAPGETIVSSVPGGQYGSWSGTSMAAPFAAGTAALLRAAEPGLNANAVTERLVNRGKALCRTKLRRLDAAATLGLLLAPTRSCTTSTAHTTHLPIVGQ
jgi:subtilisin family serine protease